MSDNIVLFGGIGASVPVTITPDASASDLPKQVADIGALKAVDTSAMTLGTTRQPMGRFTAGDCEMPLFRLEAANGRTENGVTIWEASGSSNLWIAQYNGPLNAKWAGARGDGLGQTPTDIGETIESDTFNTFTGTVWETSSTSPHTITGPFSAPRTQPYKNEDTLDYIGIQICLAIPGESVYIPRGVYKINLSINRGDAFDGLVLFKDLEKSVFGDGANDTYIEPLEDAAFFSANQVGVESAYHLFTLYRVGGPQTSLRNLHLRGPINYDSTSLNLTVLWLLNCNGVRIHHNWFVTGAELIKCITSCSDIFISENTFEFGFNYAISSDASSTLEIDNNNIWSSATIVGQAGIEALGDVFCRNNKFRDFYAGACIGVSGIFANNTVYSNSGDVTDVIFTGKATITGNRFESSASKPQLRVDENAIVANNFFETTSNQANIELGNGTTARRIVVSCNTIISTNVVDEPQNRVIIAVASSTFTAAADASVLITNNNISGLEYSTIGTQVANVVNGAFVA